MLKRLLVLVFATIFLFACRDSSSTDTEIKVAVIAGPEAHLMEVAKTKAKQCYGLTIKIVTFTDYNLPNAALQDGSVDANMFQHKPFLDAVNKARGYDLVPVGKTFVYPMGIYSSSITKLVNLPQQAKVAIPNDPSNEARALLLLQKAQLIRLKKGVDVLATPLDIADNPKQLQFVALDAAQLPRSLHDVAIAVINTNFAIPAGLHPSDALFAEDSSSLYDNIIVVRRRDRDKLAIRQLVDSLQSAEVQAAAQRIFGDSAIVAWDVKQQPLSCLLCK